MVGGYCGVRVDIGGLRRLHLHGAALLACAQVGAADAVESQVARARDAPRKGNLVGRAADGVEPEGGLGRFGVVAGQRGQSAAVGEHPIVPLICAEAPLEDGCARRLGQERRGVDVAVQQVARKCTGRPREVGHALGQQPQFGAQAGRRAHSLGEAGREHQPADDGCGRDRTQRMGNRHGIGQPRRADGHEGRGRHCRAARADHAHIIHQRRRVMPRAPSLRILVDVDRIRRKLHTRNLDIAAVHGRAIDGDERHIRDGR